MKASEEAVRAFRARRGHLSGAGAASLAKAAGAVVGIQAQVDGAARWSVAMRTFDRPSAEAVQTALLDERTLVRVWAQRDTVHIYPPEDWPLVAAADPLWRASGRRGSEPPEAVLEAARARLATGDLLTRSDVIDLATEAMIADMAERVAADQAPRYAAGRIFWRLAHLGEVCFGPKRGSEQTYVARSAWLPSLEPSRLEPALAAIELTRRYLAVNGPATAKDVAHYFGTRVTYAREWMKALRSELTEVECGDRPDLLLLARDAKALTEDDAPPPPRLLAGYDTLLMAHADKSWTVPTEAHRKAIWKPAAVVAAVVLAGGQVVGTWSFEKKRDRLSIGVEPHSGFSKKLMRKLEPDAEALAAHLGLELSRLEVAA